MSADDVISCATLALVKFDGQKQDFERLRNDVEIAVLQELGQEGYEFLFEFYDPRHRNRWVITPLPMSYDGKTEIEDEDGRKVKVTPAVKRDRREEIAAVRLRNKDIEKLYTVSFKIVSIHCNKPLNLKFKELGGVSYRAWKYITDSFGSACLGPQDIGYAFMALLEMKMAHKDLFSNFIIVFECKKRYVGLDDVLALALLQSEGDGIYKVCMLPPRLQPAVRFTKADKMDYDVTKEYLHQQDMLQHSRGLSGPSRNAKVTEDVAGSLDSTVPHPGKVQKVSTQKGNSRSAPRAESSEPPLRPPMICYNCQEVGHHANACPKKATEIAAAAFELLVQQQKKKKKQKKKAKQIVPSSDEELDASESEEESSDGTTDVAVRQIRTTRYRSISPILGIPASRFE